MSAVFMICTFLLCETSTLVVMPRRATPDVGISFDFSRFWIPSMVRDSHASLGVTLDAWLSICCLTWNFVVRGFHACRHAEEGAARRGHLIMAKRLRRKRLPRRCRSSQ